MRNSDKSKASSMGLRIFASVLAAIMIFGSIAAAIIYIVA